MGVTPPFGGVRLGWRYTHSYPQTHTSFGEKHIDHPLLLFTGYALSGGARDYFRKCAPLYLDIKLYSYIILKVFPV